MCLLGLSCGAAHGEGVWPPAAMKIHDGAEWGLQWGLHTRELDVPQEGCVPALDQAPGRTCDPMGRPCWSSVFLKDQNPWEGPTLGQFVKNCSLWEGPTWKFTNNCLLSVAPHAGTGDELMMRWTWDELTVSPHSLSPCAAQGEEAENLWVKLSLGRREGWAEGVSIFQVECAKYLFVNYYYEN